VSTKTLRQRMLDVVPSLGKTEAVQFKFAMSDECRAERQCIAAHHLARVEADLQQGIDIFLRLFFFDEQKVIVVPRGGKVYSIPGVTPSPVNKPAPQDRAQVLHVRQRCAGRGGLHADHWHHWVGHRLHGECVGGWWGGGMRARVHCVGWERNCIF